MERRISIREKGYYEEDYQMRMLRINPTEYLLRVMGRGIDDSSCYEYEVSGKVSMSAMFERGNMRGRDVELLMDSIREAIRETERHLLNIHCLLLQPEYIFYEEKKFYFCYFPPSKENIWEGIHRLTEYLVKHIDYDDPAGVEGVFFLHKKTMEENYSLEKISREYKTLLSGRLREQKEAMVAGTEEKEKETETVCWEKWEEEGEMEPTLIREAKQFWEPVKNLLKRRKKKKWGDWEGFSREEIR